MSYRGRSNFIVELRSFPQMKTKLVCLLFAIAIFATCVCHADTINYDFTAVHGSLGEPGEIERVATFSLAAGQAPDFYDPGPDYLVFIYKDIDVRYITTQDGIVLSDTTMLQTVDFYVDGLQLPYFVGANLNRNFFTGSPYSPSFVPGRYISYAVPGDYVDIVAQTPEPSTLALLGTGLIAAFSGFRRLQRE
jgi:hypothetical protein